MIFKFKSHVTIAVGSFAPIALSLAVHFSLFKAIQKNESPFMQFQARKIPTKFRVLPLDRRQESSSVLAVKSSPTRPKVRSKPKNTSNSHAIIASKIPNNEIEDASAVSSPSDEERENHVSTEIQSEGGNLAYSQPSQYEWDSTPLVQSKTIFPKIAQEQGIEGWVLIKFDIDLTGRPTNLEIIKAEPKGYFEFEAKKTIRKRMYKPYLVDGVPSVKKGLQVKIEFSLVSP